MSKVLAYLGWNELREWAKRKPNYPTPPQMYLRMRKEFYPFWWAYFICWGIRSILAWGDAGTTPTSRYTSYATSAILGLFIAHRWNCKRRWLKLQARVREEDYMCCPSCAHDLRGCLLKGGAKIIATPEASEPGDAVLCPECGDGYKVKELPGFWELPLPKWYEIGRQAPFNATWVESAWVAVGGESFSELPKLPQMYVKMRRSLVRPVWLALIAGGLCLMVSSYFKPISTPLLIGLSLFSLVCIVILPVNWLRARARWFELKGRAEVNEHLNCPSCAHDLRGTVLQSGDRVIQSPAKSEPDDAVWCSKCGDGYKVKELPGFWNLPVQWYC